MSNYMYNCADYYGRKIKEAIFNEDEIYLTFEDGVKIKIWDAGQSCCESRYMRTEDNISDLNGNVLNKIDVKDGGVTQGKDKYDNDDFHEINFLEIQAGHETFTVCTHVEHNGYYGGFVLDLEEVK